MVIRTPVSHPNPSVSVVIPTLPENKYEPPYSLENQTADDYEVVVVSDARLNRCEARNRGIQAANADVIAQTDDDCKPPQTWLEDILEHFQQPELAIVEGPLDKHQADPRNYIGANLAYRKKLALEIGGFDVSLSGWRADTDFGWRMEIEYDLENCRYDPRLEIEHIGPLRTNVNREQERMFRSRYPERYFTVLDHPTSPIGKRSGMVTSILYNRFPRITERAIRFFNS